MLARPRPKRHHYLPECYLVRFGRDDKFWIYDSELPVEKRFREGSPRDTAVISHYYSLEDEEGRKDTQVEEQLAILESKAVWVLNLLEQGVAISFAERFKMSLFMGFLAARTPSTERATNEVISGVVAGIVRKNIREGLGELHFGEMQDEVVELLDSDEHFIAFSRNARIDNMIELARRLARDFFKSNWTIARADPATSFVTSDSPFGIPCYPHQRRDVRIGRFGIASPEVVTAFPLSSQNCLLMSGDRYGLGTSEASRDDVRRINLAVIEETERLAIARDERHLRSLVRDAGLDSKRHRVRMKVEDYPHPSGDPLKSILLVRRERGG